ncbi:uncharacterized protein LOC132549928 [Ylistrum balloti]|uniref:uncharacterized protein LOC132549928 n=1 Tax=Ylistrum balloti TaxID=509963 RepID=UPI002905DBD1|nr:uncharacterized protein LOC132549928 [Ylistrum balloti]
MFLRYFGFNTLLVTPSFVRGITIDPAGDFLIACIVPNLTNQPEVDCGSHGACVIRYFIQRHCVTCPRNAESGCSQFLSNPNRGSRRPRCICSQNIHCVKGSKVTRENLFQYPFRVVASTNGDIAVSDHGNKTVWLLSNTGTLLGSYNQSYLRIYTNHGLTFDTNNDLLIVQSGLRNIIRIRRYVDGSTSVKKYAVSELESQTVTAAAVDSRGSLIVVMGRALIKVLLKKSSNGLKR